MSGHPGVRQIASGILLLVTRMLAARGDAHVSEQGGENQHASYETVQAEKRTRPLLAVVPEGRR